MRLPSEFIEYLLEPKAQQYFAEKTNEYPLVQGVEADDGLQPLSQISAAGNRPQRPDGPAGFVESDAGDRHPAVAMALALTQARYRLGRMPWPLLALALFVTGLVLLPPVYLVLRATESGTVWDVAHARYHDRRARPHRPAHRHRDRDLDRPRRAAGLADGAHRPAPAPCLDGRCWRCRWPCRPSSAASSWSAPSAPAACCRTCSSRSASSELPSIYGFWGAWFALSFLSYPYVFLSTRAGAQPHRPRAGGGGAQPRQVGVRDLLPRQPAASCARRSRAGALLVALYTLSEFGAVSMLRYDTLTPLVYIQYTTSFDRSAAAVARPAADRARCLLRRPRWRHARPGALLHAAVRAGRRASSSSERGVAGVRGLRAGRCGGHRHARRRHPLLAGQGPDCRREHRLPRGGDRQLRRASPCSQRCSPPLRCLPIALLAVRLPSVLSSALEKLSYSGQALPAITIALALVFFAAHYVEPLYQTSGSAHLRLRGAVPARGAGRDAQRPAAGQPEHRGSRAQPRRGAAADLLRASRRRRSCRACRPARCWSSSRR